ncbi:DUF6880 family protein [Caulobacter sp. ErkDOM-E]|uniref:DUF6880 family protein n=1 Tax=Caulobacter sp. ErkDOM-E TaxID=3402778 RepID=UPI003AF9D907
MARATASTTDKPAKAGIKAAAKARKGSKTTLSEANLADLGAERLATILMDLSVDGYVKRALRLELVAEASPEGLALEISKRLAAIAKATSRIHWRKRAAFARDLDLHFRMIQRLAESDPKAALTLLMDFLDLAGSVFDRISQPEGPIGEVFVEARDAVGDIALSAKVAPVDLADRVARLILCDDYFVFGPLVAVAAPSLGVAGQARLGERLQAALTQRPARSAGAYDAKASVVRDALRRLADINGDVEAFIATFSETQRRFPAIAAEIGRRLLAVGKAGEALAALEAAAATVKPHGLLSVRAEPDDPVERAAWEDVYLEALQANGRQDEAQRRRWAAFEATLSIPRLRAFLKGLPDFDDVVAEDDAKKIAAEFPRFEAALAFLIEWPDLAAAARLIINRHGAINGADEDLLTAAARRLEGAYPLAATLLLRAMIRNVLTYGVAGRYRAAAQQWLEMESLAPIIADFGEFPDHETFMADLRAMHGRKQGFRAELEALGGVF